MSTSFDLLRFASARQVWKLLANITHKGFFDLLSANLIIGFLSFGSQLLVAKFLAPNELGQIKIMQSFVGVGIILAGFGFNTAVLKLCSEKVSLEERAFIFRKNAYYTAFPVLFLLIALFLLARTGLLCPDPAVNKWLPLYMCVIPAMTYTALIISYLQALKRIQLMARLQAIIRLLAVMSVVGATYLYGLAGFVWSVVATGLLAALVLAYTVRRDLQSKAKVPNVLSRSLFYAKWSVAANAFAAVGGYLDIFLLNYLSNDRIGLGYYSLSTIFILGMTYVTSTAQSIATPYFSEKSDDAKEFMRVLRKYQALVVLLAFSLSAVSVVAVPPVITFVYGADYAEAGDFFRVLALKYFFLSCYSLLGAALVGLGEMKYSVLCISVSLPISTVLGYLFITSYGLMGAAVAQAASYFVTMIIAIFVARHAIRSHFAKL